MRGEQDQLKCASPQTHVYQRKSYEDNCNLAQHTCGSPHRGIPKKTHVPSPSLRPTYKKAERMMEVCTSNWSNKSSGNHQLLKLDSPPVSAFQQHNKTLHGSHRSHVSGFVGGITGPPAFGVFLGTPGSTRAALGHLTVTLGFLLYPDEKLTQPVELVLTKTYPHHHLF